MPVGVADQRIRGRVARFPMDSKLGSSSPIVGISPINVATSLDLDQTSEDLAYTTNNTNWGVSTAWTVMFWCKIPSLYTAGSYFFNLTNNSNNDDEIRIELATNTNTFVQVTQWTSSGGNYRQVNAASGIAASSNWVQYAFTFSSTSTIKIFKNASDISGTPSGAGATPTNSSRRLRFGKGLQGYLHSVAMWSAALDSNNLTAVYNGGDGNTFDLRSNSGNYTQSSALKHWWVFGSDSSSDSAMGTDWGAGTAINIMTNASNITTADLITDAP